MVTISRLSSDKREMYMGANSEDTIFLGIPSLTDNRCHTTLQEAFKKADRPELLVVGVCEQNAKGSHMCLQNPVDKGEVRVISIPSREATGTVTARERITRLYQGEDIFMLIDAHTGFVDGWDSRVREAMANRPVDKCVLTHYPHDSKSVDTSNLDEHDIPVITSIKFDGPNDVMQYVEHYASKGEYVHSRSTAGGCMIMRGSVLKEVPYDPTLKHLFQGEELFYASRLYTHGYELYAPPSNIITHRYVPDDSDADEDKNRLVDPERYGEGAEHIWDMLRKTYETPRAKYSRDNGYGFGNVRSLQDFFEYVGIDPHTQEVVDADDWVETNWR